MDFKNAIIRTSIFLSSLGGIAMPAAAKNAVDKDPVTTHHVDTSHAPTAYSIPKYAEYSNVSAGKDGISQKDYAHSQRYTYLNVNMKGVDNYIGDVKLQNIVTAAVITRDVEVIPAQKMEEAGGLYFNHGYDKFTVQDIVTPSNQKNVNLDQIAKQLVTNPTFELKMTGHADRSGDSTLNQELSEHRLETGKNLLLAALERQGLSANEAKEIFDTRVAPHTTIIAEGEMKGPVKTADGVKEQGNRVVTFDLIVQKEGDKKFSATVHKNADFDNHEHMVVLNLGASSRQKDLFFYPHHHGITNANQFSIPDENTNFIIKIDPERKGSFVINHCTHDNNVTDNTNFLIESDKPGAVSSTYNFATGAIDIKLDGKTVIELVILDRRIDPANTRIGQVSSDGQVTITPLTNLDKLGPLSESRQTAQDNNVLTNAADQIVHISIAAKHMYMEHHDNPAAYQQALSQYKFADKVADALKGLEQAGIETKAYQSFLINSYSNPNSSYYSPDQVVFPFQTYQGLYETQSSLAKGTSVTTATSYKDLLKILQDKQDAKSAVNPGAARNGPMTPSR